MGKELLTFSYEKQSWLYLPRVLSIFLVLPAATSVFWNFWFSEKTAEPRFIEKKIEKNIPYNQIRKKENLLKMMLSSAQLF